MNKVMNEENRRRGGRNTLCRLFRPGRWFLCLALLCSVMLPGFASAAPAGGDFCENLDGGGDIRLKLPPSVTVQPGQNTFPDIPDVTARYRCIAPGKGTTEIYPIIIYRADGGNLLTALRQLGLKMDIYITDTNGGKTGHWTIPDSNGAISPEYVEFGNKYVASTGTDERTMTIRATLSRTTSQSKPGFYVLPSLSAFKLQPYYNGGKGPLLVTPPLRLQYVPKCFVKTTVPPFVKFGPVMTTDVNSSFSVTRIFQVTADADFICGGMNNNVLKDPVNVSVSGGTTKYYLDLPLKVSFIPQGDSASDISDDRKSLLLRNDEKKINGLKLQIFNENTPVTFGDISTSSIRPPDTNKFGNFYGSDSGGHWHAPKDYKAVLSSTGGSVLTGSYNAQVLVKVEYY